MLRSISAIFLAGMLFSLPVSASRDPYSPLKLYNGSWTLTMAGSSPKTITNHCNLVGKFFTCEQSVNHEVALLLIFIPKDAAGHYYTQSVTPDGKAAGRGALEIDGNRWTYSSSSTENGATTSYRTINVFSGTDRIHFEQQESKDGASWETKLSGDEVRIKR